MVRGKLISSFYPQEFKQFVASRTADAIAANPAGWFLFTAKTYWLDAYYDDKTEEWITRTTGEIINWEQ